MYPRVYGGVVLRGAMEGAGRRVSCALWALATLAGWGDSLGYIGVHGVAWGDGGVQGGAFLAPFRRSQRLRGGGVQRDAFLAPFRRSQRSRGGEIAWGIWGAHGVAWGDGGAARRVSCARWALATLAFCAAAQVLGALPQTPARA